MPVGGLHKVWRFSEIPHVIRNPPRQALSRAARACPTQRARNAGIMRGYIRSACLFETPDGEGGDCATIPPCAESGGYMLRAYPARDRRAEVRNARECGLSRAFSGTLRLRNIRSAAECRRGIRRRLTRDGNRARATGGGGPVSGGLRTPSQRSFALSVPAARRETPCECPAARRRCSGVLTDL